MQSTDLKKNKEEAPAVRVNLALHGFLDPPAGAAPRVRPHAWQTPNPAALAGPTARIALASQSMRSSRPTADEQVSYAAAFAPISLGVAKRGGGSRPACCARALRSRHRTHLPYP